MKTLAIPLLIFTLIVVNVTVLNRFTTTSKALNEQQTITVETKSQLIQTKERLSDITTENSSISSQLTDSRSKMDQLQAENEQLKARKQAKADELAAQAAKEAEQAQVKVTAARVAPTITGDKYSWLAASGIPADEWGHVDYIVQKESGWNPNAINASSGACGLGQQLPCGKWSGAWNDPVAALIAMDGYATSRYGSWSGAYNAWVAQNWW